LNTEENWKGKVRGKGLENSRRKKEAKVEILEAWKGKTKATRRNLANVGIQLFFTILFSIAYRWIS